MLVGFIGTLLHVVVWLLAVVFDIIIGAAIKQEQSPGAFTYWLWGFITLMVGFVALVSVTIWHAVAAPANKIPEGGAPPFLMTLFLGGAQISLILTILSMIASTSGVNNDYYWINSTLTAAEQEDERTAQRNLLVWSMLCKVYIVQCMLYENSNRVDSYGFLVPTPPPCSAFVCVRSPKEQSRMGRSRRGDQGEPVNRLPHHKLSSSRCVRLSSASRFTPLGKVKEWENHREQWERVSQSEVSPDREKMEAQK